MYSAHGRRRSYAHAVLSVSQAIALLLMTHVLLRFGIARILAWLDYHTCIPLTYSRTARPTFTLLALDLATR